MPMSLTPSSFPSILYPPSLGLMPALVSASPTISSSSGSSSLNTQLQINTSQLTQTSPLVAPSSHLALSTTNTNTSAALMPPPPPPPPAQSHQPNMYHAHSHHRPQFIWYYPNPPVSHSSALFLPHMFHQSAYGPALPPPPTYILVVKGAAPNITINEILHFFNGYDVSANKNKVLYLRQLFFKILIQKFFFLLQIYPDCIQIQNSTEVYGQARVSSRTVDVLIALFNRTEAERAVVEKNHQKLGNNVVELYLSF